ncbi:MAG: methylated-DNA--[protein]-cysteine S-methyltransferase [Proteobacteria bacterium]|nr:methylated-DNA--[protein]-cysteine S-methyltransferase [Pseudomonadota bacterium]
MDLIRYAFFDSSLGNIVLISKAERLIELDIKTDGVYMIKKSLTARYPDGVESPEYFYKLCKLLDRYLKGDRVDFDIDVDISHLGIFTWKVLEELRKIPYGEVTSYGRIGKRLGYKNAARAVGQAVGRNSIPIIIPCHRVIREDGTIGGFSMGVQIKERLLATEGVRCSPSQRPVNNY